MEWMLEKIVEIGVDRVTFLICQNSIRKTVNLKRLNKIALSAMKQTQNYFLPIMIVVYLLKMLLILLIVMKDI